MLNPNLRSETLKAFTQGQKHGDTTKQEMVGFRLMLLVYDTTHLQLKLKKSTWMLIFSTCDECKASQELIRLLDYSPPRTVAAWTHVKLRS